MSPIHMQRMTFGGWLLDSVANIYLSANDGYITLSSPLSSSFVTIEMVLHSFILGWNILLVPSVVKNLMYTRFLLNPTFFACK